MPIQEKARKQINLLVPLAYLLFFGLRGFIGWDWVNYYPLFDTIPRIDAIHTFKEGDFELGFIYFTSIIKTINPDFHFFIFINSLITTLLMHIFLKRYVPIKYYAFAFLMFIVMEGLTLELNLIRNIKSILLFLISLKYIENRNLIKFLLLNILGLLFHWSAVFYLPLYFFLHKRMNLVVFIVIFIVGNIIYLLQIEYIKPFIKFVAPLFGEVAESRAESYLKSSIFGSQYGITLGYIERVATSLLIMFYYQKLLEKSKSNVLFVNSFIIFFIVYFYFSEITVIVNRVGILFIFTYWILWSQVIILAERQIKIALLIFFSVYLNVRIISMTNNILYKYDNIAIGTHESYESRLNTYNKVYKHLQ